MIMPPGRSIPSSVMLSPNLGRPQLMAPEELHKGAVTLVLATSDGEPSDWSVYTVKAQPSYAGEGQAFELDLSEPEVLDDDSLPPQLG